MELQEKMQDMRAEQTLMRSQSTTAASRSSHDVDVEESQLRLAKLQMTNSDLLQVGLHRSSFQ